MYGLNPYYSDKDSDLEIVAEIGEGGYDWSLFVLWRHKDGRLFYADDSGCSCSSPFDDADSLDDLNELTDETWKEFEDRLSEFSTYGSVGDEAVKKTDMLKSAAYELRKRV